MTETCHDYNKYGSVIFHFAKENLSEVNDKKFSTIFTGSFKIILKFL